jgi:hypothetical protein
MERERIRQGNGHRGAALAERGERHDNQALGDVARDVMDHASMIVRDRVKIGRLEARRYVEHLKRDVAPRASFLAAAVVLGGLGALFGLIAVFLGIASAIGPAWAFAIYCAVFILGGIVCAGFYGRPPIHRDEGEEIARRFPGAHMREGRPQQSLIAQRESAAGHREIVYEARREAVHDGERRNPRSSEVIGTGPGEARP